MSSRPTAADAFALAKRRFLGSERVDMSAMALELGVNRVTLYRWVGSREQLLVDLVWALAERTLRDVEAESEETGAERVVAIVTRFLEHVIANTGMQRWVADEGELAMRLLTRHDKGFQPRLIDWIDRLLRRRGARPARRRPRGRLRDRAADRVLHVPGPDPRRAARRTAGRAHPPVAIALSGT